MMLHSLKFAGRRAFEFLRMAIYVPPCLIVGKAVAVVLLGASDPMSRHFQPISIEVPDHCRGENPEVRYTRAIHRPWSGRFDTRFDLVDDASVAPMLCPYPGLGIDLHAKPRGESRLPFSAFFQCPATLPAGRWQGRVTWTRIEPWRPLQTTTLATNEFTVRDCR